MLLTTTELCSTFGLRRQNLWKMIQAGLPVAERRKNPKGGPDIACFDREVFLSWIMDNGRDDAIQRILGAASERILAKAARSVHPTDGDTRRERTEKKKKQPTAAQPLAPPSANASAPSSQSPAPPPDPKGSATWDELTERIAQLFMLQWGTLVNIKRKQQAPGLSASDYGDLIRAEKTQSNTLMTTYETLRRGAKDAANIALSRGEVRPIKEIEQTLIRMATTVRDRVLSIASRATERIVDDAVESLAPDATPEQRQQTLGKVWTILTEECDMALAALGRGEKKADES